MGNDRQGRGGGDFFFSRGGVQDATAYQTHVLSTAACQSIFVLKISLKKWSSTEQASNETD